MATYERVVDWAEVVRIANAHTNVGSYIVEDYRNVVEALPWIPAPMATHSVGKREWDLEQDADPIFFEEEIFNGCWILFREEEVTRLAWTSATSGTRMEARKEAPGQWLLTLTTTEKVPGIEYRGYYWEMFWGNRA